jgi:hypothetical protein
MPFASVDPLKKRTRGVSRYVGRGVCGGIIGVLTAPEGDRFVVAKTWSFGKGEPWL